MSELKSWSTSAGSNNSASPDGFPEGMAPSGVNDSAREVMAALARYRADTDGVNTSGGSSNAYTLAASTTYTAYAQGDRFCFKSNFANTGAATLNVDSAGAKAIKRMDGTDLVANDIPNGAIVDVVYDGTNFQLVSAIGAVPYRNVNNRTSAPGVGEDSADGFVPGSIAVDVTNDRAYVNVDASAGAAVWKRIDSRVLQVVEATPYTTRTDISTQIPTDDTIPQNSEGVEICSVSITPASASNRLVIEFIAFGAIANAGSVVAALFQDSTASALTANLSGGPAGAQQNVKLRHEMAAGTTSSTTFSVRVGPNAAATNFYINGNSSGRLFGGVAAARLSVKEIAA